MAIEINLKKLKNELIYIYNCYITENKDLNKIANEKSQEADGLWSGDFLFEPAIEKAIRGLRYIYLEPKLSREKAKQILADLEK